MDLIEDAGVTPEEEEADSGNILINLSKLFPTNAGRATELRRNAPLGAKRIALEAFKAGLFFGHLFLGANI